MYWADSQYKRQLRWARICVLKLQKGTKEDLMRELNLNDQTALGFLSALAVEGWILRPTATTWHLNKARIEELLAKLAEAKLAKP
ncbi:MAG: hypothetical protein AAB691_01690 [Patescibacteria group bacterium]